MLTGSCNKRQPSYLTLKNHTNCNSNTVASKNKLKVTSTPKHCATKVVRGSEVKFHTFYMRYELLVMVDTVIMIWDEMPCGLADRYKCFRGTCCLCFQDIRDLVNPEDRGSRFLQNTGTHLTSHLRRM
jgi:hypothetical protein